MFNICEYLASRSEGKLLPIVDTIGPRPRRLVTPETDDLEPFEVARLAGRVE